MKPAFNMGRRLVIAVPYLWLVVFFVVPFLILLRLSVTDMGAGVDPFAPIVEQVGGAWRLQPGTDGECGRVVGRGHRADQAGDDDEAHGSRAQRHGGQHSHGATRMRGLSAA